MPRVVRSWWSRPFDYDAMPAYMAQRGLSDTYRHMMGFIVALVTVAGTLAALTAIGPRTPVAVAFMSVCLVGGAILAVFWWVRPWPTRTQSLVFVFGGDFCVAVGLTTLDDVQVSFTVSVAFALIGIYAGYFHSTRVLTAQIAVAAAVSVSFYIAAATDGGNDVYYLSVLLILQLCLFVMAPLLSQIPLSYLQDDAYSSEIDPLTGALNRRGLHSTVHAPILASPRRDEAVALMVIDLDEFKSVNDRVGHAGGDEVLERVSGRLMEESAGWAYVARLGGEEFCVIGVVPHTGIEALFLAVHAAVYDESDPAPVRASAGVCWVSASQWRADPDMVDAMARRADRLMYEAKRSGGDSVWFDQRDFTGTAVTRRPA